MTRFILLIVALFLLSAPLPLNAQYDESTERKTVPPIPESEIPEMSEEELLAIIERSDNFFTGQDVETMAVDLVIYRDPGNELTLEDMKSGDVEYKARLSPIYAHYFFEAPGWYHLKIMGMIVVSSDMEGPNNYTSLLPLPGGQLLIPSIIDNYCFEYLGYSEVNDRRTHKVRVAAKDLEAQFIRYSIYEFDVEEGYLSRIESHFDDGRYFQGHGAGEFYYAKRKGKLLPQYGRGEIFFRPFFHINLWGTWFKWDFNSVDFDSTLTRGDDDSVEIIDIGGN